MRVLELDAKAVASLDRTLHEPARLAVLACLVLVDEADFVFLQSQTGMTGGNLSSHVRKLQAEGYVSVHKEFREMRPNTSLQLTPKGREALDGYLKTMRALLTLVGGNGSLK